MIWVWTVWGEYGAIHTTERVIDREEKRPLLLQRTVDDIWLIFVERTGFGLTGQ